MTPALRDRYLFVAIMLVSASVLALETLLPRIFAIYLGPNFVYFSISIALVGLSSGGIVAALWERRFSARPAATLATIALLFAASTIIGVWLCARAGGYLNDVVDSRYAVVLAEYRARPWSGGIIGRNVAAPAMLFVLGAGLILSVPFMLGGLFVALAFRFAPDSTNRLYAWDLIGAGLGCAFTVAALTFVSAANAVLLIGVGGAAAALLLAALAARHAWLTRAATLLILALAAAIAASTAGAEPFGFRLHRYAHLRSFADGPVTELRHQWTPLGRIALLQREWSPPLNLVPRPRPKTFVAMDLGGHSVLEAFSPANLDRIRFTSVFSDDLLEPIVVPGLYLDLRDYLVLMAGTGQDMLRAYAMYGNRVRLQGVELNPVVYNFGLEYAPAALPAFFSRPGISMAIDEGRSFVERSSRRFDVILLSYSGATFASGTGSLASTPQFLFTRQAFELYLSRLNPGGVLLDAAGADPKNLPGSLRTFEAALLRMDPGADIRRHVITYGRAGGGPRSDQYAIYHRNPVTARQVQTLQRALANHRTEVTYSAFTPPTFTELRDYFAQPAADRATERLLLAPRADARVHTDDRPFYYFDLVWGLQGGYLFAGYVITMAGALAIAVVFLLVPFTLARRTALPEARAARLEFVSIALIGLGFMLLEVGSIQKFELFLGNPTLTLVAVLGVLVICSAVGSFFSSALFDRGVLTIPRVGGAVLVYGLFVLLFVNHVMYFAMALPQPLKIGVIAAVLFPLGFLLGNLFPQLLRRLGRIGEPLIPAALAINGIFSVLAANLGAILYLLCGATVVFSLGLASYAMLGVIHRRAQRARTVPS